MKLERAILTKRKTCVEQIGGRLESMQQMVNNSFVDMRDDYHNKIFNNWDTYRKLINTVKHISKKNVEEFEDMEKETENMKSDLEDGESEDAIEKNHT